MSDFYIEKKIYYHDTDAGGVVYYGSYLQHLEESRSEFCSSRGIDLAEYARNGFVFPVVHLEIDYKSPARYGDVIRISSRAEKIGRCSVHFQQEIRRQDTVLVTAKMIWACVDKSMKPQPIPENMRLAIQ